MSAVTTLPARLPPTPSPPSCPPIVSIAGCSHTAQQSAIKAWLMTFQCRKVFSFRWVASLAAHPPGHQSAIQAHVIAHRQRSKSIPAPRVSTPSCPPIISIAGCSHPSKHTSLTQTIRSSVSNPSTRHSSPSAIKVHPCTPGLHPLLPPDRLHRWLHTSQLAVSDQGMAVDLQGTEHDL